MSRWLSDGNEMQAGAWLLPVIFGTVASAMAQDMAATQDLLLEVVINGQATGNMAMFKRLPNGKLAASPADLQKAGIKLKPGHINADGLIPLDSLKRVTWVYDEPRQMIFFQAVDGARESTKLDVNAASRPVDFSSVHSDFGLVVNYVLYGTSDVRWGGDTNSNLSGDFDSRLLTPFGTVSATALARLNTFDTTDTCFQLNSGLTRLETGWRYTDPENQLVYQAGDSVSGSLSWNSSYRFGGLQLKRNFNIRPDLITSPVPALGGSASLPSTLDLYLNNIKVFSGDVPAGPFDFTGLPFLGGGGDARIVMRDELGREVVSQRKYFFAPNMLRSGYLDFSTEIGFVRRGYGEESFVYDHNLAGSVSARYGLNDSITLESHAETIRSLINGGVGASVGLGPYGAVNASFAASTYNSEMGGKASAFYQVSRNGYSFYVGADRTFGEYNDVGLVVDRHHDDDIPISVRARKIDRVGFSFPLGFDTSSLSLGFSRIRGGGKGDDSSILTSSWSRTVFNDASIYVTGYMDFDNHGNNGVFAGLTIPFAGGLTASSNVSLNGNHASFDNSLSKTAGQEDGAFGWSVHDQENADGIGGSRSVNVNYRAETAELSGSVDQSDDQARITGTVEGAIVAAGGGIFMANRIDDAFAVVKAGGPNVDVSLNNRRVATTNKSGRALISYLQSYQNNTVSIEPANLPLDIQPESTQATVIPADRSGVVVDFGVKQVSAAVVTITGPDGKALPVGSLVQLDGNGLPAVAGYDGRTYLIGLANRNAVTVALPENAGSCRATFEFQPVQGMQPEIGPIECR
ncbi:fimbria/pilus outer membrane usher protein [Phyllobacterium sp. 628]|uniref:fimbria/pilus outer membrane usher protein n=1 Tax=Phyllobacterium sp. 628 TaxID=2718938 RepID=UPI001FCE62E3|nr:fimbria/pilus outer membrane usher protein [Phyllobacterium sp. 628]